MSPHVWMKMPVVPCKTSVRRRAEGGPGAKGCLGRLGTWRGSVHAFVKCYMQMCLHKTFWFASFPNSELGTRSY